MNFFGRAIALRGRLDGWQKMAAVCSVPGLGAGLVTTTISPMHNFTGVLFATSRLRLMPTVAV